MSVGAPKMPDWDDIKNGDPEYVAWAVRSRITLLQMYWQLRELGIDANTLPSAEGSVASGDLLS